MERSCIVLSQVLLLMPASARRSLRFIFCGIWEDKSIKHEKEKEKMYGSFRFSSIISILQKLIYKAVLEDSDRFEQKVLIGTRTISLGRQVSFHLVSLHLHSPIICLALFYQAKTKSLPSLEHLYQLATSLNSVTCPWTISLRDIVTTKPCILLN